MDDQSLYYSIVNVENFFMFHNCCCNVTQVLGMLSVWGKGNLLGFFYLWTLKGKDISSFLVQWLLLNILSWQQSLSTMWPIILI